MAITTTTLGVALNATDLVFMPTATTGATVDGYAKIDDEWMVVSKIPTGSIEVRQRGALGTIATAHNVLAPVLFCLVTDIASPAAGAGFGITYAPRAVVSYGANGAIALPTTDTLALITKGSAAAMTLADPAGVPDGTMLTIASTTAYAHTVTLTTGYLGSAASSVLTFVNTIGGSITLVAYKGLWACVNVSRIVAGSPGVTVANS